MTSPTDLAERLREIREVAQSLRSNGICICASDHYGECCVCKAPDMLDRLAALESAASGEVTDAERNLRSRVGNVLAQPDKCEVALLWDAVDQVSVRLAAAKKAEQRCMELEALLAAPDSRHQLIAPEGAWIQVSCPGEGGTGHTALVYILSGNPLPTWPGFLCNEHLAPSSEPAPSDGASILDVNRDNRQNTSDGTYVDAWDALTDDYRELYIAAERVKGGGSVTNDVIFKLAQEQARRDAVEGLLARAPSGCKNE